MITLQQILRSQSDILDHARVKIVRHKDSRKEYRHIMKDRQALLEYQKEQGKDVFGECDYIVSFIGDERKRSRFVGVFRVSAGKPRNGNFYYDLEAVPEFEDLADRLVIDWGGGTQAWHQWYGRKPKEVIEILPRGYIGSFPGLLEIVLDFEELRQLTSHPEANYEWRHHLSAANGVYMILDNSTGTQYVGSACGRDGIWQRWSDYARSSGTGGNRELKALIEKDPGYHRHFRFSILQTLPSNITRDEILAVENLYKNKLGSRFHGLNRN
ncbi:MAG: GIY-YIG nuclease family protein [Alphaproteobacteria bacterium]|nr:GIY-YIG nuclease family protein [Alphaproteobacteria bacterium]